MISSKHFSATIFKFLYDFKCYSIQLNAWPLFGAVVTDFSFASIHAVIRSFNDMSLLDYLKQCYSICCNSSTSNNVGFVSLHLCCAHFMKMVSKDARKIICHDARENIVKDLIARCMTLTNLSEIKLWFKYICTIFLSKYENLNFTNAYNKIMKMTHNSEKTDGFYNEHHLCENEDYEISADKSGYTLYKSSPFYKLFVTIKENADIDNHGNKINEFYSHDFIQILITKYMPYVPLWSRLILAKKYPSKCRLSNSYVESYFGNMKSNILEGERSMKCSRFVRKNREYLLAAYKEVKFDIKKTGLTGKTLKYKDTEEQSQEIWKKKNKSFTTHFSGTYLKPLNSSLNIENNKSILSKTETDQCLYCGLCELESTVNWLQCDMCQGWVHYTCLDNNSENISGNFYCKHCFSLDICIICSEGQLDTTANWGQCDQCHRWVHQQCDNNFNKDFTYTCRLCTDTPKCTILWKKCEKHLKKINLTSHQRKNLEIETRSQRNSPRWLDERLKRITASNFGKIIKCQNETSKLKLAKTISNPVDISHISAVRHGLEEEKPALKRYLAKYPNKYTECGLFVHNDYQFLAGSPDGFINDDGLIEIKCPYSLKGKIIHFEKLNYIDNKTGRLKRDHNYYFQVQGLLEITNREWCDFVVYTGADIHVQKIYRDKLFFLNNVRESLRNFYYHYYLPTLLTPEETYLSRERDVIQMPSLCEHSSSTSNPNSQLDNGLVDDILYYEDPRSKWRYFVAKFDKFTDFIIREIDSEDFHSLSGAKWLTGTTVSIILNILSDRSHQVLDD